MAANPFSQMGSQLVEKLFSGMVWFGIAILIIGIVGFLMYWFLIYRKKFDIKVKIISQRAGNEYSVLWDKAAILIDRKTHTRYFKIWGLKRELPVPKYNILQRTDSGDLLEIYRKSEEEFYFLTQPIIDKTRIIKQDGKMYPFADQKIVLVDPEIGFWAAKRKDLNRGMFSPESLLMKILPYIPQIMAGVITIFILYILMDTLPTILAELQKLAQELNSQRNAEIITGFAPLLMIKWNKK